MMVTVPEGKAAGDRMQVQTPTGVTIELEVPTNHPPGATFAVAYSIAAAGAAENGNVGIAGAGSTKGGKVAVGAGVCGGVAALGLDIDTAEALMAGERTAD